MPTLDSNALMMYFTSVVIAPKSGNRGEVLYIEHITAFVVSVMASIVAYYVCKWLDGDEK